MTASRIQSPEDQEDRGNEPDNHSEAAVDGREASPVGSQVVDDEARSRLREFGLSAENAARARYVVPPLDVDTFRYCVYLDGYDKVSVQKRPQREHEASYWEGGQSLSRQQRQENDEYSEAPPLPDELKPHVPDSPEWSQYQSYRCRFCRFQCLNRRDSPYAETTLCRSCYHFDDVLTNSATCPADD